MQMRRNLHLINRDRRSGGTHVVQPPLMVQIQTRSCPEHYAT